MRRSELDAVGARVEQPARELDDARRLSGEREQVEHVVGDLVRRHVGIDETRGVDLLAREVVPELREA